MNITAPRRCRVCGCTDDRACPGGCWWVAEALCSACAPTAPGYWMNETSGVLRPAIEAFLLSAPMAPAHIAAMRAYLRQWVMAPAWRGAGVEKLRADIDGLTSRPAISRWINTAIEEGLDPL